MAFSHGLCFLWQKPAYDPYSLATLFDLAVMFAEPAPHLAAYVPARVVPDQKQDLLAECFELLSAPSEKPGCYAAHGPTIHEPKPRLVELRQIESVAGEGFRIGIVLSDRLLDEARRLPLLGPALLKVGTRPLGSTSTRPRNPRPTEGQPRLHSSVGRAVFFSFVQGIGRCDPSLGSLPAHSEKARKRCPDGLPANPLLDQALLETHLCRHLQRPEATLSLPNSLGERCSSSLKASALFSSKVAWVLLGREEPATKASRPRSLKLWIASRTVCAPQPKFLAICGATSPRELAKSIWDRRKTKVSFERSLACSRSRSSFESFRTKIGGFMAITVTHNPKPALSMH
jgi:hypothetical protein